ncbi:formimidoylglutamase [Acinetobacter rudis]|uniref:Formimidoylglutamase n=1 Tax=Acinetobacter rudis TaxID=632955 RepID=A0AAW8J5Z2_9GAMM|nr:formimidoylglutamase [Acinetobacter rudis]MDQ8934517.1 formimidoylglutamase [Acinetobacter rudis]MDQ9016583.1 formimidoylglutamase [Acinetobacter rudis]
MQQKFKWQGRHDGEGAAHKRIHHIMNHTIQPEYVLLGFASDEGVKRNHGRVGAVAGPQAIRQQLCNLPVHEPLNIADLGDIVCQGEQLERAQDELSSVLTQNLAKGHKPIVLGGGHEVAFASFKGLFDYNQQYYPERRIGIINFDAHFDLRQDPIASSGTPFFQAAQLSQQSGQEFKYLCLGVAQHSNTKKLFDTAETLHCQYVYDYEFTDAKKMQIQTKVKQFITEIDDLYVTIDLDVFSAHIAPGVSAPAVKGIDLTHFEWIFQQIVHSSKVRLLDFAECNPSFDVDNKTARLAAYIIYQYLFINQKPI